MRMPSLPLPPRLTLLGSARFSVPIALAILAGCAGNVGGAPTDGTGGAGGGATGGTNVPAGGSGGGTSGSGGTGPATGGAGGGGTAGGGTGGAGGMMVPDACLNKTTPGRAPLRRLTRFEYNNTVRDILYDTTSPGSQLPSEVLASTVDLFGNNADSQPVSSSLARAYSSTAGDIATRATATPAAMAKLDACAGTVTATTAAATQDACARKLIEGFTARAYRRPVATAEVDELFALHKATATAGFASGIAGVIEAVLQAPDFLYRVENGVKDAAHPGVLRPTGDEMATRLSYTLWGTAPDAALIAAAKAGQLDTADGVRTQATRLLADPKSHQVVSFFFDKLLPIESLTDLTRDPVLYPKFTPTIGSYMREETQRFLEYEIFENPMGSWKTVLTAPYTFVNATLAAFYGIPGITGTAFQKAPINTAQRKGLLTQGGVMTGTITTNQSNPVLRGSFVVNKLLCQHINLPADPAILAKVKIPEVNGKTARERFSSHSADNLCKGCHQMLDPLGFALENFDAVGLWRDTDTGITIDASGSIPGIEGTFKNAVGMIDAIAGSEDTHACFASHWLDFAFGRLFDLDNPSPDDACISSRINAAFKASGYNVKQLLVDLTQSDAFLYMPAVKE